MRTLIAIVAMAVVACGRGADELPQPDGGSCACREAASYTSTVSEAGVTLACYCGTAQTGGNFFRSGSSPDDPAAYCANVTAAWLGCN